MPFLETRASGSRRILSAACGVDIVVSEDVQMGDALGVSNATETWVRSTDAGAYEQPLLIASVDAPSGERIKAYPIAIVEVTNTSGNKGATGNVVSVEDTGEYKVTDTGEPDAGIACALSTDTLKLISFIFPMAAQLTTVRAD